MKRIDSRKQHSLVVQPAFLIGTYNPDGTPNFCPITWISVTSDNTQYLLVASMNGAKRTKENIARTGLFSANLVSTDMLALLDYFGLRSAMDGPKDGIATACQEGHVLPVPTLDQSRWVYECRVVNTVQTGETTTYIAKMENVQILEELQDADGLWGIDLTRLDPVVYSGMYHAIGKCLGSIGDFHPAD